MDNNLKKLRLGLNDRTSLLESLGWDDEELTRLERYLSEISQDFIVKHPGQVLSEVRHHFGEETATVLKYLFANHLKQFLDSEKNK